MRRLYLSDEHFRSICEDLVLATTELREVEANAVPADRAAEILGLRDALCRELVAYVGRAASDRDAG